MPVKVIKTKRIVPGFYDESDICIKIRAAFPQPEWATLFGVRDSTGWAGEGRIADAMAFGTWPSRGFKIIGFECKSYRSDWMHELKNPEKAESIAKYCDEWYVVATEDVVNLDEVPKSWGWYVPADKGLKIIKHPIEPFMPKPIDKIFLMSLVRNISQTYIPEKHLNDLAEEKLKKAMETMKESAERDAKYLREDFDDLRQRVDNFQKESGIEIGSKWGYDSGQVGALVKTILDKDNLMWQIDAVKKAAESCADILEKIKAVSWYKDKQ